MTQWVCHLCHIGWFGCGVACMHRWLIAIVFDFCFWFKLSVFIVFCFEVLVFFELFVCLFGDWHALCIDFWQLRANPLKWRHTMNNFNTTSKTIHTMIVLSLLAFIGFFSTACGQSEAYYAVQGENDNTTLMPKSQVDGKADTVVPDSEAADFDLSGEMLRFDTNDYDSVIVLKSTSDIKQKFGQGATWVRHTNQLAGLIITWDGAPSDVWVRPRSASVKGKWAKATTEVQSASTHRVSFRSDLQSNSYDVFFTNPESISFLLIETIAPAQ